MKTIKTNCNAQSKWHSDKYIFGNLVSKSSKLRQTQPDKKKCRLLRQKGNKRLMCYESSKDILLNYLRLPAFIQPHIIQPPSCDSAASCLCSN